MANLESLLEYQTVDIELRKILDEIERSEFNRKMEQAKQEFNAAKLGVTESEKAAEGIVNFYNTAIAYFEDCQKKTEQLEKRLGSLGEDDEAERREIVSQLELVYSKISELEKKLHERRQKSETIIHSYLESQERGKKLRDIYKNVKAKLESVKAEKEPKIKELTKKLDAMSAGLDKPLFEQYKQLTAERKYPALVEAGTSDGGKNYSCRGCGLALSQKTKSELAEKGLCRCETCRRIIFKRK